MSALTVVPDSFHSGGAVPTEVTSYVGRDQELAQGRRLLAEARLVTLVGSGGVGKTRLAGRIASAAAAEFDGVVFVELAELRNPALVADVVVSRFGLRDQSARSGIDVLVEHLRDHATLLVLDNCEHLVDACAALVRELVARCPRLRVLATSRQSLGVAGEQVQPVPPLAVPDRHVRSPAELLRSDAVRLFVDRAKAVTPSFAVTEDNAADVVRLCRHLEGLPLAIELAAVRTRALSVRQLAERLVRRLPALTHGPRTAPQRQQTLRATVEWSHGLCSPAERLVWARASAFSGPFDLDAAEHVCGGAGVNPADVLIVIDGLLDKSVLMREDSGDSGDTDGVPRFRMLETLREFGAEQLERHGDRARVARLHRDWYARLSARFAQEWVGPDQLRWVRRLWRDHPNLRVAGEFCVTAPGEAPVAARMGAALMQHYTLHGLLGEGRRWMDRALARIPVGAPERGTALWLGGMAALVQADLPIAAGRLTEAGEWAGHNADEVVAARVATGWGIACTFGGDLPRAVTLLSQAVDTFRARGMVEDELFADVFAAQALALSGDTATARGLLDGSLSRSQARGEIYFRGWLLHALAQTDLADDDLAAAASTGRAALRAQSEIGNRFTAAFTADLLAWVAVRQGRFDRAATMFGVARTIWTLIGSAPAHYPAFGLAHDANLARARAGLGEAAFTAAFERGRALPPDEALRYALAENAPVSSPGVLTRRESEIARLVAAGGTNREIADRLAIAQRTVESHVDHILRKLGCANRAQITAWVAGRPPE
ncbi:ATP-binding protein [Actinokineospora iranica]|uniref:Non-specific serine/threonine protein kinase n=1 Tax=Actinokineospora iranica TaxID=1271860 RepID=A0A1G6LDH9_9PSEU|nr:LuxR C-terminal-related transcriptional regulator [Actinokineospora iranica]SDC41482.1 non-specific serine/threonine protein kinase [Actinokineospora iranica]